ncbi:unnamed protein product [Lampetra planeri]
MRAPRSRRWGRAVFFRGRWRWLAACGVADRLAACRPAQPGDADRANHSAGPHGVLTSGEEQGPPRGVSEDPLVREPAAIAASARLPAIAATRQDDAILGGSAGVWRETAILVAPRETPAREVGPGGGSGMGRSHHLPNLK